MFNILTSTYCNAMARLGLMIGLFLVFHLLSPVAIGQTDDEEYEQSLRERAQRFIEHLETNRELLEEGFIIPTLEQAIEAERRSDEHMRRTVMIDQLKRRNIRIVQHIHRLIDPSQHSFGSVMLSPEQQENLKTLHEDILDRLAELVGRDMAGERLDFGQLRQHDEWRSLDRGTTDHVDALEEELRDGIFNELFAHQLRVMANTPLTAGLPRILIESPIGELVELTDRQQENIGRKSEALANEIEEFVKRTRQRAMNLVAEELTNQQKEQLFDLYGRERTLSWYSQAFPHNLYNTHKLELPEALTRSHVLRSPLELIMSSELDDRFWQTPNTRP